MSDPTNVVNCDAVKQSQLAKLLKPFGLQIHTIAETDTIPGSFFGEREAGLIGNTLYLRYDTPVHSALHESCHYICMEADRRQQLDTDTGGDYDEENAVCYLQILLADFVPNMGRDRMMLDMDSWGYSFRLGSARSWFEQDAEDARDWLIKNGIINHKEQPLWQLRQEAEMMAL